MIGRPRTEPMVRFMSKVKIQEECWEWLGGRDKDGYGKFRLDPTKSNMPAHRAAHILFIGPMNKDEEACHRCDNTWCVNPAHVFKGSRLENEQDKTLKARRPHGEKHWNYKHGEYVGYKTRPFTGDEKVQLANHQRWHVQRSVTSTRCGLCKEEA